MIQTVDFFTPIVDDPYMFGQIAAANSLSDVWAMGGEPAVALNIVGFPNCLDPAILGDILAGGADKVKEAVSAVNGQAVLYNGAYAQTVYFASSGGKTANANEVWGGYIPYLISVPCPVDAQYSSNYGVIYTYSSAQMAEFVKNSTGVILTDDPSLWFSISRSSSGYVNYVGIGGQGSVTGQQFRANVMKYKIKSANFTISYDSATDMFTVTTYGFGHGVGMSQTGAHYYATYNGWNYEQILTHFYTGTVVAKG